MANKKPLKSIKEGEEIKFIPKDELQNMRLNLSIEIPQEDFDELVKAMMGGMQRQKSKEGGPKT